MPATEAQTAALAAARAPAGRGNTGGSMPTARDSASPTAALHIYQKKKKL